MGDETAAGMADLFHREHHPWLAVVVVVTDGDRPRHQHRLVVACGQIVFGERVVVDRAAHRQLRRAANSVDASDSTVRKVSTMNVSSTSPAINGGASVMTGSARSSARQINPASYNRGERCLRSNHSDSAGVKAPLVGWS